MRGTLCRDIFCPVPFPASPADLHPIRANSGILAFRSAGGSQVLENTGDQQHFQSCTRLSTDWTLSLSELAFFSGVDKRVVSKGVVLADVPPERKPERGYIQMFPWNENRNEGTFACSPGTKTGTRAHSPQPPFYETALFSPSDFSLTTRAGYVIPSSTKGAPDRGHPHRKSWTSRQKSVCFLRPR